MSFNARVMQVGLSWHSIVVSIIHCVHIGEGSQIRVSYG